MTTYTSGYTSGNYEAFVRPRKPELVEGKSAYFVGSGLASLAGAVFLVRDAQMPGANITILEQDPVPGGALDGIKGGDGFVIRGGRELEDHMECLWDVFRSIPSLEVEGASVLEEVYWLNKDDPNWSLCRVTHNQGEDARTLDKFGLGPTARKEIKNLFLATRESMQNKRIDEVFGKEFFESNFWIYWQTMFAWEPWHGALECKLYLHRFIHHIQGLPNLSALKFTKYNQYESFVLPLRAYLESHGVVFKMGHRVTDIKFSEDGSLATRIDWEETDKAGKTTPSGIDLTPNDLLFTTIGSLVENSVNGDHHSPATTNRGPAAAWDLWRRIAAQSPSGKFGKPDVFGAYDQIDKTRWQSCTVTTLDKRIPVYIERISKRDPFSGRVVTGGIVTAKDSAWLLSWTVNRQPHFKAQPKDQIVVWVYGLYVNVPGDFVKKPMEECTGEEITQEWLYHMGVPEAEIPEMAATGGTAIPTMMPYVTSFFMPRTKGDRPAVIPEGAQNFAFIGQFAESRTRDTIFTTEYSVRTAMEAVYGHLKIERGVPEVFNSTYDIRWVAAAMTALNDGEKINPPLPGRVADWVLGKVEDMSIGEVLARTGIIKDVRPESQKLADD